MPVTSSRTVSVRRLLLAIKTLPSDKPVVNPKKWYKTQKEHWIGWLSEYHGPGAYGRQTDIKRDARYVYNHVVQAEMLLWLIDAAKVSRKLRRAAHEAYAQGLTLQQKSAAIRRIVPFDTIAAALWPDTEGFP